MTEINKKLIAIIVATMFAALMLCLGILSVAKIKELNDEMDGLNSQINQLQQNDYGLQWRIDNLKNEITNLLNEQGKNYYDVSISITDVSVENNSATLEVHFSLKESPVLDSELDNQLGDDDQTESIGQTESTNQESKAVAISFGSGSSVTQQPAIRLAGGKYMTILRLELDKNYDISYSATFAAIRTEKLLGINVLEHLRGRLNVKMALKGDGANSDVRIDFFVGNEFGSNNSLKLSSLTLEIFKSGASIKTLNLMDYNAVIEDSYQRYSVSDHKISGILSRDLEKINCIITATDDYGVEYVFSGSDYIVAY